MNNNLVTSAYFNEEDKNSETFYLECFEELRKEICFSFGAIFYKKGRKYFSDFKAYFDDTLKTIEINSASNIHKLKIPIKMQGAIIGYFLLARKNAFKKEEKALIEKISEVYTGKIKDFEISKIFKNQLLILQNAIVEKNKATKKLEEQNEKLIETDKIRGEFLANVSHELRTPLNSIIGFSTALKDGVAGTLNDKQRNYANKILSSAIHLTGLINDILDMTKIEAGAMKLNLKLLDPNLIIKEVVNILEPLAYEKNITIETDFKFNGEIKIDCAKFRQIIYNLTGNAIKFSHKNSKVIISTKENRGKIQIAIKDFGIGIDKKYHKKIFEKFVQLDNIYTKTYSSTGLGLAITGELIKMLKGKIRLNSSLGKGSVFTLEFTK